MRHKMENLVKRKLVLFLKIIYIIKQLSPTSSSTVGVLLLSSVVSRGKGLWRPSEGEGRLWGHDEGRKRPAGTQREGNGAWGVFR